MIILCVLYGDDGEAPGNTLERPLSFIIGICWRAAWRNKLNSIPVVRIRRAFPCTVSVVHCCMQSARMERVTGGERCSELQFSAMLHQII